MKATRWWFALLILLQFALFWQYAQREIVWAYPADFDQSAYLVANYTLYREALHQGLFPAIGGYLHEMHPTGLMLPLQETLLDFSLGPGRLSALSLNFAYFAALQIVLFGVAKRLVGWSVGGWLGIGLLLMSVTAFAPAGGMFDCRIDFITFCLYGIFTCCLVDWAAARAARSLALAGGCALLMVSFRFVTFAYLVGLTLTLLTLLFGLRWCWRRRPEEKRALDRTLWQTAAFGLGVLLGGGLLIALNWQTIHDYYVVGHATGSEKGIRAAEQGLTSLAGHLTFYANSLFRQHLGVPFTVAGLGLVAWSAVGWFLRRSTRAEAGSPVGVGTARVLPLLILFAALFAPWFILTLDESKSPVVVSVLTVPVILLVVFAVTAFSRVGAAEPAIPALPPPSWWSARGRIAAGLLLTLGALNWLSHLAHEGRFAVRRASVEQIEALYDHLGDASTRLGFVSPTIASDVIYDWTLSWTINANLYERRQQWLGAQPSLGSGIFAVTPERVFTQLAQADIVLLTTYPKTGVYPFYDSIRPLAAGMREWCAAHLMATRTFLIDQGEVTVYLRPAVPVEGYSGGWITPDGIRLRLPAELLAWLRTSGKNAVVLAGDEHTAWLPRLPRVSAQPLNANGQPLNAVCPADYTRPTPDHYRISIDLRALLAALPSGSGGTVALRFGDSFFVPRDLRLNDDSRQLIVTSPTSITFE